MKKYKLILIRHGETKQNKKGVYLGCKTDAPLCEDGIDKAIAARCRILELTQEEAFIICSPMLRCQETMRLIYNRQPDLIAENLREMDFGDFEGKNYEDLKDDEYYQKWLDSEGELPFPNGESKEEFSNRTMRALQDSIVENRQNVIVAHGGTVMAVMSRIAGGEYFDYQVKNLDGFVLEYSYDSNKDTYNEISYMRIDSGIYH